MIEEEKEYKKAFLQLEKTILKNYVMDKGILLSLLKKSNVLCFKIYLLTIYKTQGVFDHGNGLPCTYLLYLYRSNIMKTSLAEKKNFFCCIK